MNVADRHEAVYIISVAAELVGMHPQTLRIYERKGLIEPSRTPGGTRRYSESDIELLGAIQELTTAGVNLEGARRIMELRKDADRLRYQVVRRLRIFEEAQVGGGTAQVIELAVRRRNLPDVPRN